MQLEGIMTAGRSRTLPLLRVSEKMRADAVSRSIDFRKSQQDFVTRGLASADRARETGHYVSASKVVTGLRKRRTRA